MSHIGRHVLPILLLTLASPLTGCAADGQVSQVDVAAAAPQDGEKLATFAGGCFWCMEPPFEGVRGVRSVVSGYTGGPEKNPTYEQVSSGRTGHTEAVQVVYNPKVIGYDKLLELFWRSFDPTDGGGQFADRGSQYRPGIFVHDEAQRKTALASKKALGDSGRFDKPIAVEITDFTAFYPAEGYHQDYYLKNPSHYKRYRKGSGRTGFLVRVWGSDLPVVEGIARYGKPPVDELRKRLTPLQFDVTQEEGTERPFQNEFWNNKHQGIYVDVVSGEPLFSSQDKFDSGTGWPSFVRPLVEENVMRKVDHKLGVARVEVRSKHADSHLGHVFDDGPKPTGMRYCINSAALRFVPVEELVKAGYGDFAAAFAAQGTTSRKSGGKPTSRPSKQDPSKQGPPK